MVVGRWRNARQGTGADSSAEASAAAPQDALACSAALGGGMSLFSPSDSSVKAGATACSPEGVFGIVRLAKRTQQQRGMEKWTDPARLATEVLHIGFRGVEGDYCHYRSAKRRERDWAVSIMTTEALGWLQAAGYDVGPGDLGENITLSAPEHVLSPGVRLRGVDGSCSTAADRSLVLEIVEAIVPCRNLEHSPCLASSSDRARRAFPRACKDQRGWFARVIACGELRDGDSLLLLPASCDRLSDPGKTICTRPANGRKPRWMIKGHA